ncbi:hypothetical protein [Paraburkholderia bryophila]|uniref:Uncharacterized protein n=1 Tax=Paraburkholderia bryophila TaxID=420952 RepID=A0A7Z0B415_9BURK|nr:hypothetical protein [Paraburkholderia bryophila]NYH18877.1 hypothetical protein [Paraburkholderia bryophila]
METEKSGRLAATRQHVISRLSRYIGPSLSEGAIDAAVSAGRLVEWKSPNNTVIQSVGVSIVLRNLSQRLDDYAKSAQNVGPATGGRHAKNQVCAPIELLALPCSTALAVANRANPTERPLHIVPTLTERDAINATGRGRAITFAETLTRLPHPKRKSYRTLFVHNCDGLDLLTLSKVLQRLPMGGWLRLCFSLAISPGQLRILQTITSERLTSALKATNLKLSEQLCGTSDDMTRVSEALRHGSPIALDRVEPGCTISGGAAFMRCSDRLAVPNETKAAFYASNFRGKTAIVAPTAIQCAQFNIDLHNDRVDYLRASDQQNPFIRLRNHESATVGEPVVCRSNLHRLNLTSGSIGKIVAIFDKPRIAVIEGTVVELSVLIDFESIGKTLVSMEELKTLSLAYALPLSRARFSEWEHIVVPITRSKAVDNTWIRQTSGIATRSILFIGTDNNCMRTSEGCHAFTEGLYV